MYKIYINQTKVLLLPTSSLSEHLVEGKDVLVSPYTGKSKSLFNYIDMFEKSTRIETCIIHSNEYEKLLADFRSLFIELEAGGGLVQNEKGLYLFIYRRKYWDLPKGKQEKGESMPETAIREVEEETGIKNIRLGDFITTTYHTYKDKKSRRCIKISHWYKMYCDDQDLIPQIEEDIETAEWLTLEQFYAMEAPTYHNILDVLNVINDEK